MRIENRMPAEPSQLILADLNHNECFLFTDPDGNDTGVWLKTDSYRTYDDARQSLCVLMFNPGDREYEGTASYHFQSDCVRRVPATLTLGEE